MNVNVNQGKQERKYHTFLGKKYRVDSLPCGISIPFEVELKKLRDKSIEAVNSVDPNTPTDELYKVLNDYYTDHLDEAHEQLMQMVKTISIITEFFTDGEVNEDYIQKEASEEEVRDFLDAVNGAQQEKTIKKLLKIREDIQSVKPSLKK